MHHFFVLSENIYEDHIVISGEDFNHAKNVLRLKSGEEIILSSGDNVDYYCTVEKVEESEIIAHIDRVDDEGRELPSKIYLFQGLPKNDKMEGIIQKAVELGVFQVIPVAMKRSIVKLDAKKEENKLKRWNEIAKSAAKQSKRSILPEITRVYSFKEAVEYAKALDLVLVPYECADGMEKTKKLLENIEFGKSVGIFIGPEGGFDGSELDIVNDNKFEIITLGKRILRTETASLMILSVLMYHFEQ